MTSENHSLTRAPHTVSVVIPVYQGEKTLPMLMDELDALTGVNTSPEGNEWSVQEVICVYDHGRDDSPRVLHELSGKYSWLKVVWLSRNFGQHPATLAGISASGGNWVATIDEDGQQDPQDIGLMLDTAINERSTLVYASPLNKPPHGFFRNISSKTAKKIVNILLDSKDSVKYNSFRLILGEVARSAAAYAGSGVYMDVALGWVAKTTTAGVMLRDEGDRVSGYSFKALLSHFWRMVVSSGTRSLRMVSLLGAITALIGITMAIVVFVDKLVTPSTPIGWASTIITILVTSGLIMLSLGVIAEYLGVAVSMAMGKPLYLVTSDPEFGPFARTSATKKAPHPDPSQPEASR